MEKREYLSSPIEYKAHLLRFFNENDGLVIFDIGACEGLDSIKYANLFPNSKIYAFEPLPKNFEQMEKNIDESKKENIQYFQLALSDTEEVVPFYVSSGNPSNKTNDDWDYGNKSSSLLSPKKVTEIHDWLKFNNKIDVQTNTLMQFCALNKIDSIDVIHMDVQGAEMKVLTGASNMISNINMIWLETSDTELYQNQPLSDDLHAFLSDKGFIRIYFTKNDALYLKQDLSPLLKELDSGQIDQSISSRVKKVIGKKLYPDQQPDKFMKPSYSQSGEDMIIKYIFTSLGIKNISYMDIGAHHPKYLNNTFAFYLEGCKGINIEPDPTLYSRFTVERDRDVNLNIGIADSTGHLEFYIMNSKTLNTFSREEANEYEKNHGYKIEEVKSIEVTTIDNVITKYNNGACPDLVSIDVEGFDEAIIRSIDFSKYRPLVLCIETISFSESGTGIKNDLLINYIISKGYVVYGDTNINTIFVKEEAWIRQ